MKKQKKDRPNWPAAKVEMRALSKIKPYDKNPRTHPDTQIDLIASSMRDEGVTAPILVDEQGVIIYGHGRRLAAIKNGYEKYPVVVALGWSEEKKRGARIKDNQYAMLSSWSPELLRLEVSELKLAGFDMPLLGFDAIQLVDIMTPPNEGLTDPDEAPEPPKNPVVRRGDLWEMGSHRLLCGDCTNAVDVEALLGKAKPHLMVSDPPYGVKRDKGFEGFEGFGGFGPKIARRQYKDEWDADRPSVTTFASLLASSSEAILFGGNFFADILPRSTHWIVWDKKNTMPTFGDCELAWTNMKRKSVKMYTVEYNGLIGKEKERFHPTQKPVELIRSIVADYSLVGAVIFDPFVGSGTTIIAAEMTGRKCLAIEIDPAYVEVGIHRYEKFSGKTATLDGQTLAQVAKARRKPTPQAQSATRASKRERGSQLATPSENRPMAIARQHDSE